MERTPRKLPCLPYNMDVTSWNLHHGSYFMEPTPWMLPSLPYTMEVTSWN